MPDQALSDVRLLDLTWHIAGPYCTKLLADYGAEVIKVERPGSGDPARSMGPFLGDDPHPEKSGLFLHLNTNKKSITLNLKSETGKKILKELVKGVDILVESFRPHVMPGLGLSYEELEKVNPRLVMTSISSFGQTGPYRDFEASHLTQYAISGWMCAGGEPGREPLQCGGWLSHYIAGLHAAIGTMFALHHARETGVGQHVDLSVMEAMVSTRLSWHFLGLSYGERRPGSMREGNILTGRSGLICPCKDGYIAVNLLTQGHWELFVQYMQKPELEDAKYETPVLRRQHARELSDLVFQMFRERECQEVFHSGQQWRVPIGLIPTTEQLIKLSHTQARESIVEMEHPVIGKLQVPGPPFKMLETPWCLGRAAPLLGQHNEEVYGGMGYSRQDLVRFRESGVL